MLVAVFSRLPLCRRQTATGNLGHPSGHSAHERHFYQMHGSIDHTSNTHHASTLQPTGEGKEFVLCKAGMPQRLDGIGLHASRCQYTMAQLATFCRPDQNNWIKIVRSIPVRKRMRTRYVKFLVSKPASGSTDHLPSPALQQVTSTLLQVYMSHCQKQYHQIILF